VFVNRQSGIVNREKKVSFVYLRFTIYYLRLFNAKLDCSARIRVLCKERGGSRLTERFLFASQTNARQAAFFD
jgi:hypothetical protein